MDLISIGIAIAAAFFPIIPDPADRDIDQFPQTLEWLAMETGRADQFRDWLERRAEIDRASADDIQEMLTEISRRRDLYMELRWLKLPPTSGETQTKHLRAFRCRLGWKDYMAGRLPPIVPLEYYRRP